MRGWESEAGQLMPGVWGSRASWEGGPLGAGFFTPHCQYGPNCSNPLTTMHFHGGLVTLVGREPKVLVPSPVLCWPNTQGCSSLDLCVIFSFFRPNNGMSSFQIKGSITSTTYRLITRLPQLSASQRLTPTGLTLKPHRLPQGGRTGETFSP